MPVPKWRQIYGNYWDCRSSKMERDVTFDKETQRDYWLTFLESRPEVIAFVERPIFESVALSEAPVDFWTRRIEGGMPIDEIVVVGECRAPSPAKLAARRAWSVRMGLRERVVPLAEIRAQGVWLNNWRQIQPFLSGATFETEVLESALEAVEAASSLGLGALVENFLSRGQLSQSRILAHVFCLLQRGLVRAPVLEHERLSFHTQFQSVSPQPSHASIPCKL